MSSTDVPLSRSQVKIVHDLETSGAGAIANLVPKPPAGVGAALALSLDSPKGPAAYNPLVSYPSPMEQLWALQSVQVMPDGSKSVLLSACAPPGVPMGQPQAEAHESSKPPVGDELSATRTVRLVAGPPDPTRPGATSWLLVLGAGACAAISEAGSSTEPEAKVVPDVRPIQVPSDSAEH